MFNERDRRCTTVELMLSTDPSYDNRTIASTSKCKSGLPWITGTCPGWWKQSFRLRYMVFGEVFKWGPHHATSHLWSRLESQHQSVPGCAEEWWSPGAIRWPVADSGCRQQDLVPTHKSKRTRFGFRRSATTLYPSLTGLSRPEPTGLLRLVIRQEHHQHDLPQHSSQPDCSPSTEFSLSSCQRLWKRHAPSSRSISRR